VDASTGLDPGGGGRDGRAHADLVDAVKKGAAGGASLDDLKKTVGNQLAPKYEAGMSKYPVGQYRDRVGVNIEHVYNKLVKKG
jgi:hypothetical protein